MSKISLTQIKDLRKATSAPVMECKKALEECHGDFQKAKLWLKKRGLTRAAKKKERQTKEGLIHAYVHSDCRVGVLVKLVCETDFVARNKKFVALAHEIALQVAAMKPKDIQELLGQEYIRDSQKTIQTLIDEAIAQFGENIKIEEFVRLAI